MKHPPYYGRLGHDANPAEVRRQIVEARVVLDDMETLLDNPLTFDEANAMLSSLFERSLVLTRMSMLRPVFISHLIGRLVSDGLTIATIANKLGIARQKVNDLYYVGAGGRPTKVPRTRRKPPVTKGAD